MLLEETPAVLSLAKLCEDHGYTYHWTSGQKPHLMSNGKRNDCNKTTMYNLWFVVYQRVLPQLHLKLLLHHLRHRIPYLISTDTSKIQYQKEVESRVKSFGETRCMRNPKRYKEIYRMNCLIGCRNSERIWLMKVLRQSLGETQSKEVKTLPGRLMNLQWSRGTRGTGFGKAQLTS